MQTYFLLLVTVSLVLVVVYLFLGESIPVEPLVYYLSVGFSLILSLALPSFLASLNIFAVSIIYVLLILFFALSLTLAREKFFAKREARVPGDPENRYVGKKVGLFTGDREPPPATFAEVLARHVAALLPRKERPESPAGGGITEDAAPVPADSGAVIESPPEEGLIPQEDHFAPEDLSPPEAGPLPADEGDTVPENRDGEQPVAQAAQDASGPPPEESPEDVAPARQTPFDPPGNREHYAAILRGLFQTLEMKPPLAVRAGVIGQLSEVYQELGQYWQGVEVIRTFLLATGGPPDDEILNSLIVRAAYCQAILRTLLEGGLDPVPYARLTEEVRATAAKLAGKLILEGGWQGEEIAGDH